MLNPNNQELDWGLFNPDWPSLRDEFLRNLKSKGSRYLYSRYKGLPLRYAGGKSLAVGHVVEKLPTDLSRMMSPFIGGGSVEIACARELDVPVVGYDVFDILTTYWQVQLKAPAKLAERIKQWQPTPKTYAKVKIALKAHWDQKERMDNDMELAAHYWFNHNLSYGPGFLGWMSGIYEDETRFARLVEKVRTFHCQKLRVRNGAFGMTIPKHNEDFLYCDPPYYLGDDSQVFKGIYPQRNFPIHHNGFDHKLLRDLLRKHKGGFLLSYNDCETIRDWYSDCDIYTVEWQYTMGQGETRIGKNRLGNGSNHVKDSHELLIRGGDGMKKPRPKGMKPENASLKKIAGHVNEQDYADLIGGRVPERTTTGKSDVFDRHGDRHSVKSGKKTWQIFMYARSRIEKDTVLKGLGKVSPLMLKCLDTLSKKRADREANPDHYKKKLQAPMRKLAKELSNQDLYKAFIAKAAFEAGEVKYLAILPPSFDQTDTAANKKHFHLFDALEAVDAICANSHVTNSKARGKNQTDDQKVVFRHKHNIGEIEIRIDPSNYGKVKLWFHAKRVLELLQEKIPAVGSPHKQITVYGKAKEFAKSFGRGNNSLWVDTGITISEKEATDILTKLLAKRGKKANAVIKAFAKAAAKSGMTVVQFQEFIGTYEAQGGSFT